MRTVRAWVVRIGMATVLALLAAQLVPVERTNPTVAGDVAAAEPVGALLRRACYDCHSNETVWPWYSGVAPVSWLLAYDVAEGRRELNFSTWTAYDAARRRKALKESIEEMREGEMPPWIYLAAHAEARLTPGEREAVIDWLAGEARGQPER